MMHDDPDLEEMAADANAEIAVLKAEIERLKKERDGNLKAAAHFSGLNMDMRSLFKDILPHLIAARHAAEGRMDNEGESEPYFTLDTIITQMEETMARKQNG